MNFNRHSNLEGQHAFLGASKYHWINYSEDKVAEAYSKFLATQKGTVLHDFAARCISLGQKLPKSQKTLNMYVNDAIGYKMTPEQVLMLMQEPVYVLTQSRLSMVRPVLHHQNRRCSRITIIGSTRLLIFMSQQV